MNPVIISYLNRLLDDMTKSKVYREDSSLLPIINSFKYLKTPKTIKDCKFILTGLNKRLMLAMNSENKKTVIKMRKKIGFNLYTINGLMSRNDAA